ncbi:MAG TPA: ABC transporter ATP-binding protein [Bradyrhizobium sp.]|uniref:ABC transporter ATP-binding protein n=1 Tax=Bradyrhizobium sp. TaxID=376 RepID=UPI002BFE9175|nr:ABC transporter ATP-binding protein [Bradyrhizobium sp.]HXB78030.1 ABC transporter ATP-binding protein [Bradyrhizobium sp.]
MRFLPTIAARLKSLWPPLPSVVRRLLPQNGTDGLAPSIYGYILHHSLREQIYLVVVTLISFPFLYYSLDLPKLIVNRAISGKDFPQNFMGWDFDQIPYLLVLCCIFFTLVLINGWFKLHLNVRKGQVGERMLRRLRYQLYERVLRFPLHHFDRTATGQVIAMMTGELEPVGGFIGDAFALPISQGGTLLTIFVFMFVQDPILGAAAVAFYPLQGYLIPKMQRIIRRLGRERVRKVRGLSDRIAETIAARAEIRPNDAAVYQLADVSQRLGEIYDIRFEIYNRKFFVKFLNNLIGNLTPFLFFLIGGYFVIKGELSFGALVAVLAAYKDLSSPWKELLDFYQNQQDVAIKYEQVVEQFQVPDMLDKRSLLEAPEKVEPLHGEVTAANIGLVDDDGILLLEGVNFEFSLGTDVAIVGQSNSGRNLIPQLFARLVTPTSGRLAIGDTDLNSVPLAVSGRRIGYVGPITYLFSASVRDNLLLGLRHRPRRVPDDGSAGEPSRAREIEEARKSGNIEYDIAADWIDYQQAGVADAAELELRMVEVLRLVDFEEDVHLFGLRGRLDPDRQPDAAQRVLEARRVLAERLEGSGLAHLVERFDPDRYNTNSPVSVNLLFGTPIGPAFEGDGLARNAYVQKVLDEVRLTHDLLEVGAGVARMMIELFTGLRPEHALFEQFSFISADDLPVFEGILKRMETAGVEKLLQPPRERLLSLAFKLAAARDPLDLIDEKMQQRILEARRAFAAGLPEELRGSVEFFDPERYNAAASVQENVLFGTIVRGESGGRERVHAAITEALDELDLRRTLIEVGLDYPVGTGGSRLSEAQRQKLAIAGAVLKRPDLMALNDATVVLDGATETALLDRLKTEFAGRSLVWSLHRPRLASAFDRVLVMEHGRLVDQGPPADLEKSGSPLAPLLAAE